MARLLATMQECKAVIRVYNDRNDERILMMLLAANEEVLHAAEGFDPEAAEEIPPALKMAVLVRVMELYDGNPAVGSLSADRLIHPFRKLSV